MGIQDLFTLLKDECPDLILKTSLSQWRGHSFAVDISIFLNKYIKSAGEKLWMNTFIIFLCILKKHGIKAVCIFDGPNPPIEKKQEQEARRANITKAKTRLTDAHELRDIALKYMDMEQFLDEDIQERAKLFVGTRRKIPYVIDWEEPKDVYDILCVIIEGLDKQIAPITDDQREKAWEIVKMMGLPTFQCDGEAEALCAYMAIYGYVDAVLTEDTDVLAYGTPWMVAFKDYKLGDEYVRAVHLPDVLDELELSMPEFLDLCILLSCDYNDRVAFPPSKAAITAAKKKGKEANPKSIGWKTALKLIREHQTIENFEDLIYDIEPLKYERCRELFTPITTDELHELINVKPYSVKPDYVKISEFIATNRLTVSIEHIKKCWKAPEIVYYNSDDEEIDNETDEDKSSSGEWDYNEIITTNLLGIGDDEI